MSRLSILLLLISLIISSAFQSPRITHTHPRTQLYLTPRQLQFWEDVETGLLPIEAFYKDKNLSMDRIWKFCERAKSGVAADGLCEGHEPSEEHVDGLTAKVC